MKRFLYRVSTTFLFIVILGGSFTLRISRKLQKPSRQRDRP